jgi:hypothetical protein
MRRESLTQNFRSVSVPATMESSWGQKQKIAMAREIENTMKINRDSMNDLGWTLARISLIPNFCTLNFATRG